jgi:hypothetical protein
MGTTFNLAKNLQQIEPNSIFLEIGSERGEGSTKFLADLAQKFGTVLHTVDLDKQKANAFDHPSIVWHTGKGSEWVKTEYPKIGKKISLVYLDNFDWNHWPRVKGHWVQTQIAEYKEKFNIEMNNENSKQEHLEQVINLLPWLSDSSTVLCDDTFQVDGTRGGKWDGKCALALPYLQQFGFNIADTILFTGVMLSRNSSFDNLV